MNSILLTLLSILAFWQYPFFVKDTPAETVYFFCTSRIIEITPEETQHVVVTDVYRYTANEKKVWDFVNEWTEFVNTKYQNDCGRTSDLNTYKTLEEAETHLDEHLLKQFDRKNTIVEKVNFEFTK